jgi:hypothetical protein
MTPFSSYEHRRTAQISSYVASFLVSDVVLVLGYSWR